MLLPLLLLPPVSAMRCPQRPGSLSICLYLLSYRTDYLVLLLLLPLLHSCCAVRELDLLPLGSSEEALPLLLYAAALPCTSASASMAAVTRIVLSKLAKRDPPGSREAS
jgi:hypothetical protein